MEPTLIIAVSMAFIFVFLLKNNSSSSAHQPQIIYLQAEPVPNRGSGCLLTIILFLLVVIFFLLLTLENTGGVTTQIH